MKKGYIIQAQTNWSAKYFESGRMTVIYLDPEQAIKEALILVEDENKGVLERIEDEKKKGDYDEEDSMFTLLIESEPDHFDAAAVYRPKIYKQWKDSSCWEPNYVKVLEFDIV